MDFPSPGGRPIECRLAELAGLYRDGFNLAAPNRNSACAWLDVYARLYRALLDGADEGVERCCLGCGRAFAAPTEVALILVDREIAERWNQPQPERIFGLCAACA